MNEVIQGLETNATNGEESFCYISENKLNAIKELSKRELQEKENLQKQNAELKKQLHKASLDIQELIEKDIWCPTNCDKLMRYENNWKELKEYLTDYKDVLESQKESVEGLDLFEEHTLDNLDEILSKMQELEKKEVE